VSLLVIVFTLAAVALLAAIAWLVGKPLPSEASPEVGEKIEELLPLHSQHFPQVRQALESADFQYVRRKTSRDTEQLWRAERRRILESFLDGLAEDFARLDRFARHVASMSPKFSRREELERIRLSMRFRFNYRIVSIRIAAGNLESLQQLQRMTELVGNLSARAEAAMARLELIPPSQAR
jgi:hypothetical protein